MLAFFVKNKKSNRSTDRRRGDDGVSIDTIDNNSNENRNKLVVTMMIPWLTDTIIKYYQN